ncbi:MAG TPA: beta-ketoacyl-ACP synthase II [Actinomycetota bacterium]|nr:beta-ketoacyl-ACP synthase II [Actinomycetota bacterium]
MNDVVITGLGLVTPIGIGVESFWAALLEGRSGAGALTRFDTEGHAVKIAAQVDDFDATDWIEPREAARTDRFCQMGVAAACLAWEHAALDDHPQGSRIGVIVGSGIGGLSTIEEQHSALLRGGPRRVSPFMVPRLMPNAAAAAIAMRFGVKAVNYSVSSACATGAHAVGEALEALRAGRADVMIAGGCEAALTPLALAAFARMGALSTRNEDPAAASRPFDKDRDGFVFGEGAGVVVLERAEHAEARGAEPIARLTGYGATEDAFHVTQPDPEGLGASEAMRLAMEDAGLTPGAVDYINAHGTSTPFNDRIETTAIKQAVGNEAKRIPVTSTKSQTGHLLGAAGAVELAATALILQRKVIPATINLDTPDPDCDLDYVSEGPRNEEARVGMSNSFGFGGQNACLVVEAV